MGKPNKAKVPSKLDHMSTVEQLRSAGVVAAVTITRSAFPNRLDNETARLRFASMWDKKAYPTAATDSMSKPEQLAADCNALFTCALKEREEDGKKAFVVGRTKTYFRAGGLEYLEANRAAGMDGQAVVVQALVRRFLARKRYMALVGDRLAAEREAKEAAEREERERLEKIEKEKAAKELAKQQAQAEIARAAEEAAKKKEEAEMEKKNKLRNIKQKLEEAKIEQENLLQLTSADAQKDLLEPKKLAASCKQKVESNSKEIEYLKKEHKKIKKSHDKVKKKFDELAKNNKKLMEQNEMAGSAFGDENDGAMGVHKKNETLKEEVNGKQKEYMSTAEARLEFQKTMARILNLIQGGCKNNQLIEDTVCLALDCEKDSKATMAVLDAE